MTHNPISRIRLIGNIAIVGVVGAAMLSFALLGRSMWSGWEWVIGGVAICYVISSIVAHYWYPNQVDAAWDEQVMVSHRASLAFGYWAALGGFLVLLAFVLSDKMEPKTAFFLMGPVLGAAPALWFTFEALRGRAG